MDIKPVIDEVLRLVKQNPEISAEECYQLINSKMYSKSQNKLKPLNINVRRPTTQLKRLYSPALTSSTPDTKKACISDDSAKLFYVVWRKPTNKKNKTWDGDGIMILTSTSLAFRLDESENYKEKFVTEKDTDLAKFSENQVFSMKSFEFEVTSPITDKDERNKILNLSRPRQSTENSVTRSVVTAIKSNTLPRIPSKLPKINQQFKKVVPNNEQHFTPPANKSDPLYDPNSDNAVVMKKSNPDDIDVVIDPNLSKLLRPHQIDGVKFLYECVMNMRNCDGHGALLADDMGLGKTFMTITLIVTLLKQSPTNGFLNPVANKVLIVCPVTLIGNWKREFKKWVGMKRIGVLAFNNKNSIARDKQDIKNFNKSNVYQILIIGYEKLLNMKTELLECNFDLLVCDEGHRLKNNSNKTLQALIELDIEKRILLSGTPIQNDLLEFFNMIDFINPGLLGSINQFKRNFLYPILKSRELNCLNKEILRKGEEKSKELIELTKPIILRRTASIIANHLPVRTDLVVFCSPTKNQISLFNSIWNFNSFNLKLKESSGNCLGLITLFKKICNSPSLIKNDSSFKELNETPNDNALKFEVKSGKLAILERLIVEIFEKTNEKCVIVSNYTQTLDLIEDLIVNLNYKFSRLDGSTPNKDRDGLISSFNKTTKDENFVFLLSSKSGGVGLNLIGASRLILFDNDWNPSVDLQAMARIHRDGQTKPVFIYRLITTGCIDEKIFQRQLMKNSLSDKFLDNKDDSKDDLFDINALKDLFTLNLETECNTHDLIECGCEGSGEVIEDDEEIEEESDEENSDENGWTTASSLRQSQTDPNITKKANLKNCLKEFRHFNMRKNVNEINDDIIQGIDKDGITFLMAKVNKSLI